MYVADDMGPLNRRHPPLREPSGGSQHSIEREEMIVAAMTAAGTTGRRRHLSVDNLSTIQRDGPIFVHPTVHHPSAAVHGRDHSMDEMLLRRAEQQQQRFLMEIPQPQVLIVSFYKLNNFKLKKYSFNKTDVPAAFQSGTRTVSLPFRRLASRRRFHFPFWTSAASIRQQDDGRTTIQPEE